MLTGKDHHTKNEMPQALELLLGYAETVRTVSRLSRRLNRLQHEQQQSTTLYTRQERTRRELATAEEAEERQHAEVSDVLERAVFLPDCREVLRMRCCFLMEWPEIVHIMYSHEPDFNGDTRGKHRQKAIKKYQRGLAEVEQYLTTGQRCYPEAIKRNSRICF